MTELYCAIPDQSATFRKEAPSRLTRAHRHPPRLARDPILRAPPSLLLEASHAPGQGSDDPTADTLEPGCAG